MLHQRPHVPQAPTRESEKAVIELSAERIARLEAENAELRNGLAKQGDIITALREQIATAERRGRLEEARMWSIAIHTIPWHDEDCFACKRIAELEKGAAEPDVASK